MAELVAKPDRPRSGPPKIDRYPKDRLDAFTKWVKEHRSHEDHNLLLNWLMYWRKYLREEAAED